MFNFGCRKLLRAYNIGRGSVNREIFTKRSRRNDNFVDNLNSNFKALSISNNNSKGNKSKKYIPPHLRK